MKSLCLSVLTITALLGSVTSKSSGNFILRELIRELEETQIGNPTTTLGPSTVEEDLANIGLGSNGGEEENAGENEGEEGNTEGGEGTTEGVEGNTEAGEGNNEGDTVEDTENNAEAGEGNNEGDTVENTENNAEAGEGNNEGDTVEDTENNAEGVEGETGGEVGTTEGKGGNTEGGEGETGGAEGNTEGKEGNTEGEEGETGGGEGNPGGEEGEGEEVDDEAFDDGLGEQPNVDDGDHDKHPHVSIEGQVNVPPHSGRSSLELSAIRMTRLLADLSRMLSDRADSLARIDKVLMDGPEEGYPGTEKLIEKQEKLEIMAAQVEEMERVLGEFFDDVSDRFERFVSDAGVKVDGTHKPEHSKPKPNHPKLAIENKPVPLKVPLPENPDDKKMEQRQIWRGLLSVLQKSKRGM